MTRSILLLGVPRSGTSCVAGVLWRLGVDMGSGHLQPADRSNPGGYYEDLRWQKLNKALAGIRYGVNRPTEITDEQKAKYHHLAKKCEADAKRHGQIWGFKNPRACFTAHFIWPHLEDVRLVVTTRKAEHSAQSIQRHSQVAYKGGLRMTFDEAEAYIRTFALALQHKISLFEGPIHTISYTNLLNETTKEIAALEEFCYEGLDTAPTYPQFQDACAWVNRKMDHYG